MTPYETLAADLKAIVQHAYPDMQIRAEPWPDDTSRTAIYFVEAKFAVLYPAQRFHYLQHLIPADFYESRLANSVWFELAPGEEPGSLEYPDEDMIKDITSDVMRCVNRSGFVQALDNAFSPRLPLKPRAKCYGDFRLSKALLPKHRFKPEEFSDVFHVLMAQGGYCDCEILYNVAPESRLKAEYWKARAAGRKPRDPHGAGAA
jgi:hypothetical protein